MFRFIHTADVHLDSPLRSLALKEPEAAGLVANATRQSFSKTVDICIEEKADAFLIAGDLYDGELRSMKTAAFFAGEMRRLAASGVKVYMVRGNHDAESVVTKHLDLPDNVYVFSKNGEAVRVDGKDVVLHGMSFAKPAAPQSLLPHYSPAVSGSINIGLLHTSLAGSSEHDVYAPCSLQDLLNQGYDYWALGHIHKREVHATTPSTVVMPGIPQGRHINEAGPKSITYVTIDANQHVQIEERHTNLVQFERINVDLSGVEKWRGVVERAEEQIGSIFDKAQAGHVIARIHLTGTTTLAMQLRRDADVLAEELREAGRRSGSTFIEKVVNETASKAGGTRSSSAEPITELRQLLQNEGMDRSNVLERTQELLDELKKKLPPQLRDRFEAQQDDSGSLIENYLRQGTEEVLAQLVASGERA